MTVHTVDIFMKCWPAVQLFQYAGHSWIADAARQIKLFHKELKVTIWCSLPRAVTNSIRRFQGSLQLPKDIIDCRKIKMKLFLPSVYIISNTALLYPGFAFSFSFRTLQGCDMHHLSCVVGCWFLTSNLHILQGSFSIFPIYAWKLAARLATFVRSALIFVLYSSEKLHEPLTGHN